MGGGTLHPIPPPGVISPTNQSGLILILTGLSLSFVLVSFAIRVYIRHPKGLWKHDDNLLTGATILACAQSGVIVRAVNIGLGNRKYDGAEDVTSLYFSSHYLYILELFLSKLAIAALYLRLTKARNHRYAIWTIFGCSVAWFILAVLLLSIRHSWNSPFDVPYSRWLVIGIPDCLTDAALALMSMYLVKDLQLSAQRRTIVIAAFGVRIFTIIPCALRLYYLSSTAIPHDRGLAMSIAIVCAQLQLGYALMAASVAVLRPFMVVYDKSPDASYLDTSLDPTHQSRSYYKNASSGLKSPHVRSKNDSFKMQSLRSKDSDKSSKSSKSNKSGRTKDGMIVGSNHDQIGPVSGRSTRVITSGPFPRREDSVTSNDSKKMIIQRRDEWSVKYEDDVLDGDVIGIGPSSAAASASLEPDAAASSSSYEQNSGSWSPGGIGVAK